MIAVAVPDREGGLALALHRVSKSFDGRKVLDDARFAVRWGEVHALLGENGAGKSTIMNVATGVYIADTGVTEIDGVATRIASPIEASRHGIGMVHQHFRLVNRFTVAENILLAAGPEAGIRNLDQAARLVAAKGSEVGLGIDPAARVCDLSVAERQRVEILKVLILGARIVILDEPTAVLSDQEATSLLRFTRGLADTGHAVVLITHKLREVVGHSDRVTVMRGGRTVLADCPTTGLDEAELARQMIGERVAPLRHLEAHPGAPRLVVRDLTVARADGGKGVDGLSLELRGGEILGIAGVGGNGQQQLADCLIGLATASRGEIQLMGRPVVAASVAARRGGGLRMIPSDRFASGLIGDMSVAENLAMTHLAGRYSRWKGFLARGRMRRDARAAITTFNIAGATPERRARLLSGGNAQKLLLSREVDSELTVLVAHSPTRGLDVKACQFVHGAIQDSVAAGAACLLISEDLEEILSLSTRIAVMSRGRLVGEFPAREATAEKLGLLMMNHA